MSSSNIKLEGLENDLFTNLREIIYKIVDAKTKHLEELYSKEVSTTSNLTNTLNIPNLHGLEERLLALSKGITSIQTEISNIKKSLSSLEESKLDKASIDIEIQKLIEHFHGLLK